MLQYTKKYILGHTFYEVYHPPMFSFLKIWCIVEFFFALRNVFALASGFLPHFNRKVSGKIILFPFNLLFIIFQYTTIVAPLKRWIYIDFS